MGNQKILGKFTDPETGISLQVDEGQTYNGFGNWCIGPDVKCKVPEGKIYFKVFLRWRLKSKDELPGGWRIRTDVPAEWLAVEYLWKGFELRKFGPWDTRYSKDDPWTFDEGVPEKVADNYKVKGILEKDTPACFVYVVEVPCYHKGTGEEKNFFFVLSVSNKAVVQIRNITKEMVNIETEIITAMLDFKELCEDGSTISTHIWVDGSMITTDEKCEESSEEPLEDVYKECPDGSKIKTHEIVNGKLVETGNTCPEEEPETGSKGLWASIGAFIASLLAKC